MPAFSIFSRRSDRAAYLFGDEESEVAGSPKSGEMAEARFGALYCSL
jgi:hypothetical protein